MKQHWVVCVVSIVMACGKSSSPPPPSSSSGSGSGSGSGSAEAKAPSKPAAADAVFVSLHGKNGLVSIEHGAFKTIVPDGKATGRPIPRKGGGIYVWVEGSVMEYDGELRPMAGIPNQVQPQAASPDGVMWAASRGTVATYDGKAWTVEKTGLPDNLMATSYLFAPDGTVYLRVLEHIAVRRAGAWSVISAGGRVEEAALAGNVLYVIMKERVLKLDGDKLVEIGKTKGLRMRSGPDAVYVLGYHGVQKIEADKLVAVPKLDVLDVVFGPDGTLYGYNVDSKRIVRRKPDGTVDKVPAADLPFKVENLAVDGRGRLWVRVHYGFVLIDGNKVTLVTPGTVPELTTRIDHLIVTGNGPDMPDVGAPKLINLKGIIVSGGQPKPGVKFEICNEASSVFYGASPCEGKSFVRRATSGADGSFVIKDVPLGGWHLIYKKTADSWAFYFPDKCCGGLPKGGTFDMGQIEFGRSSR